MKRNMQAAPSARDDTVHKKLLIPKRVSSLADGALCIFVSFLTDGVFRFFM
jgi:hypothetical protein